MKKLQVNGMNVFLWLGACAIIIIATFLGVLPDSIIGALAVCFGIGSLSIFLGDHIPIWRTYLGGGVLLTMFVGASATYFHWLPEGTIATIENFVGPWDFLNLFVIVLIVGSIFAVERDMLLRAISRFIPCILAACVGAAALAILVGFLFGKGPAEILGYYVLPIMSGGSGAGALPLGEMFAEITGNSFDEYITVSMAMLSLGDLFAILTAAVLGKLVDGNQKLSGSGQLVRQGKGHSEETKELVKPSISDLANCLVLIFAVYMLSTIFSTLILPSIAGASIHPFAYAVIFTIILKIANVIPENMVSALVYTQKYFVAAFVVVVMFCCGVAYTDLGRFIACLTNPGNILICFAVVVGATLGGGLFGQLVGFYPYEAAVTAGLCMANAGGAGDVAILSSCKRMNLMPYAQISSRIGNAIILIIGSFVFAMMF